MFQRRTTTTNPNHSFERILAVSNGCGAPQIWGILEKAGEAPATLGAVEFFFSISSFPNDDDGFTFSHRAWLAFRYLGVLLRMPRTLTCLPRLACRSI